MKEIIYCLVHKQSGDQYKDFEKMVLKDVVRPTIL